MLRLHVVTPLPCPQWDMSQPGSRAVPPQAREVSCSVASSDLFTISSIKPNDAHSPWKLQQVFNGAHTHGPPPLTVVMHRTHDQKQWLKLCDRVNFQAKFPAERGTERCEEKAPVERKDTWIWQSSACGRTGLNVGVRKRERILLQTRANIYSGLSWDIWQQFGLCLKTQISDNANKESHLSLALSWSERLIEDRCAKQLLLQGHLSPLLIVGTS